MHIYEKNLRLLQSKNPVLALQLLTTPVQERTSLKRTFPASSQDILYIHGIGDVQWQQAALRWLDSDMSRRLVVLECNLASFQDFLREEFTSKLLTHSQFFLTSEPFEEGLKSFVRTHAYRPWECMAPDRVKARIAQCILDWELTIAHFRDFGIPPLVNLGANIHTDRHLVKGEDLVGCFKGVPAIICGAGPSLEQSYETLRAVNNRALMFGGGSALLPLSRQKIPLDFAVAMDPIAPLERFRYVDTPLFCVGTLSNALFTAHQGPKLCVGQQGAFPLEEEIGLALTPYDIGWNVLTFATQMAYQLGCNPIIFVGMDLCVYPDAAYADKMPELKDNPIECRDRVGTVVRTRPDFLLAKKWLEAFAQSHPECTLFNGSARGLALEGIPTRAIDLQQIIVDLDHRVNKAIASLPKLDVVQGGERWQQVMRSAHCCQSLLDSGRYHELDGELFYHKHLHPNWTVWRHLLQSQDVVSKMKDPELEKQLQQMVFFKDVTRKFIQAYEERLSV